MIIKNPKITISQEDFINRSKSIHGDKYDYSKSIYTKTTDKIIITCPIHGDFITTPVVHWTGSICPICRESNKFINIVSEIHNNYYNYSKTIYKTRKDIIIVTCPIHGDFKIKAINHQNGAKCPDCIKSEKLINFINKSKLLYHNKYDYSEVNYIDSRSKIKLKCNDCNTLFEQTPSKHLQNIGCPTCSRLNNQNKIDWNKYISKGEQLILDWFKSSNLIFSYQYLIYMNEIIRKTNKIFVDFYIFYKGIHYFIEYNGKQHYNYIPHFHPNGLSDFNIQLKRDEILDNYCNNIANSKLIKFTYNDSDEFILNTLSNLFS